MNTNEITNYAKRFARILDTGLEQVFTLVVLIERGRVPWWGWGIVASALAYFLCPLDAMPDPIFVDDLAVLAAAIAALQGAVTDDIRAEARRRTADIRSSLGLPANRESLE